VASASYAAGHRRREACDGLAPGAAFRQYPSAKWNVQREAELTEVLSVVAIGVVIWLWTRSGCG